MRWLIVLVLILPMVTCIPQPNITPVGTGVRFEIKDMGYDLVAVHYSINKRVHDVDAGDYNFDIHTKQGGYFVHENTAIHLHDGDFIGYWVYVVKGGLAHQLLNQEWTYPGTATHNNHQSHTQPPVTHVPVTQQPTQHPVTHQPMTQHPVTQQPGTNRPTDHNSQKHVVSSTTSNTNQKTCTSYPCLIFEDNFDYLDHKVWQHELTLGGGGNWEFQHYTNNRSNSYCKNGVLYIKPTLTTDAFGNDFLEKGSIDIWGSGPFDTCTGNAFYGCKRDGVPGRVINPIQSARLRSSRGFNFKYGKVEVEAKLPTGDWIWPAIWMMPTFDYYGGWPASGEIDIMESRGNVGYRDNKGEPAGVDHTGSTLHFGPNWQHDAWEKATAAKNLYSSTFGDKFHKYGVEWNENSIKFTVDGEEILNVAPKSGGFWELGGWDKTGMENPWRHGTKMAPFDQEFYIILNVAVGGLNYFADTNTGPRPKPWKEADSTQFWRAKNQWYPTWKPSQNDGENAALQINHVKVWKVQP